MTEGRLLTDEETAMAQAPEVKSVVCIKCCNQRGKCKNYPKPYPKLSKSCDKFRELERAYWAGYDAA